MLYVVHVLHYICMAREQHTGTCDAYKDISVKYVTHLHTLFQDG